MTKVTRTSLACAFGLAAFATVAVLPTQVFAQAAAKQKPPPPEAPKPVALTQAHIDGLMVVLPEMAKLGAATSDKPTPDQVAKLDQLAKKNGFADAGEMGDVAESFDAVVAGLDPETKTYIGVIPLVNKRIEEIKADKEIPAKDKAEAIKEIKQELPKTEPPKPSDGNIAIVVKNYDKFVEAVQGAEQ